MCTAAEVLAEGTALGTGVDVAEAAGFAGALDPIV